MHARAGTVEMILVRGNGKLALSSVGECFQANDSQLSFFRHFYGDYLSSKLHLEGELFPLN